MTSVHVDEPSADPASASRTLATACANHALHDGYTDALYVLLPIWQTQFGLGYGEVGVLRALYTGAMAAFQVPASALSRRVGTVLLLALGTALAGAGLLVAGMGGGFVLLAVGLLVSGVGSSTQHPLASTLIAGAYQGARSRRALGVYNFSGDLGKMAVPAATALLLTVLAWPTTVSLLGVAGLLAAGAILLLLPPHGPTRVANPQAVAGDTSTSIPSGRGFRLLLAIGVLDSAIRMGFLTFLPFLLREKGAELPSIGLALSLVFAGGAAGKLACGFLGARLGLVRTVLLTEALTALGILALLPLPLGPCLVLLPLVGIGLNGTSSVLYGSVPDLVAPERRAAAFGIFYTGTIGGGAAAPVLFGLFSDAAGVGGMMVLVALAVGATLPLAWLLRPHLRET